MKNIERLFSETNNVQEFSKGYFDYLHALLDEIDTDVILRFVEELEAARRDQSTVFYIGNGGSASTASHMANDLSLGSRNYDNDPPFRALALVDNVSVTTAIANDHGYDNLFIHQLRIHYRPGDKLVAISASGNSPNVVAAAKWVKEQGGAVIGMLGFEGGKLEDFCDIAIRTKAAKGEYGPVEDIHAVVNHLIYTWFWYRKRKAKQK